MQITAITSQRTVYPESSSKANTDNSFSHYMTQANNKSEATNGSETIKSVLLKAPLLGKCMTAESFLEEGRREKETFSSKTAVLFAQNNIDTSIPINLATDSYGRTIVTNNHPDKQVIEKLFADNPELSDSFRKISLCYGMAKTIKESLEFQKAYARDPKAAVTKYAYLLYGNTPTHHIYMTISNNSDLLDFSIFCKTIDGNISKLD